MPEQKERNTQPENQPAQEKKEPRQRLNPRLVFTDPDSFFSDLLMEQQEQQ